MASVAAQSQARSYGGMSGGERVRQRRERLLESALALVDEEGWRSLRVESLCRTAGLNNRYFYESFADLDDLADSLMSWLAADASGVALASVDLERPSEEHTQEAVGALIRYLTDHPPRARVLFGGVPGGERGERARERELHGLVQIVAGVGRRLKGIREDAVVDLASAMMIGGTAQAVLDWLGGSIKCSREQLIEDVVDLWHVLGDGAAEIAAGRT